MGEPTPSARRNVQYERALIAYIDILGFKNLIATRTANEISRTYRIFREHADPMKYRGLFVPTTTEYVVHFSDLCIIAVPFEKNLGRMGGAAWSLIARVLRLQGSLIMRHGIFIRGGVTVGPVARTYRQLFGQGVVNAYDLETRAKQARVVIDPVLLEEVGQNKGLAVNNCEQELRIIQSLLRVDPGESLPYIDYLREMHADFWPGNEGKTFADAHTTKIEEELSTHEGNLRVRNKYLWLKEYHRQTMQALTSSRP